MPKKRRKLNKDFEKQIYTSKKNVELVLAKIYDIYDDDIQKEYMSAFNEVVYTYDQLKNDYELTGFNENSDKLIDKYNKAFSLFFVCGPRGAGLAIFVRPFYCFFKGFFVVKDKIQPYFLPFVLLFLCFCCLFFLFFCFLSFLSPPQQP